MESAAPRRVINGGPGRITSYADHPWMEEMQKGCREQSLRCGLPKAGFAHDKKMIESILDSIFCAGPKAPTWM